MMLSQVSLPVGAVHDEGIPWLPSESVTASADVKAASAKLGNRAAVVQAPKHVVERDLQVVLAMVHERGRGEHLHAAVGQLGVMNEPQRFGHGQVRAGDVGIWALLAHGGLMIVSVIRG